MNLVWDLRIDGIVNSHDPYEGRPRARIRLRRIRIPLDPPLLKGDDEGKEETPL